MKDSIKRKRFSLIRLIYLFSICVLSADDITKIQSIHDAISHGDRYKLFAAELFDGDTPWKIHRGSSFLESTSFISKSPPSEAYQKESKLYYTEDRATIRKSMQIHSNIEIPGRDKVFLKPEIPKPLPVGTPVRLFFWVYSNNYDINLKVILSQKKSNDVIVDFGLLKFNGWRRLDSRVIVYKPQTRLNLSKTSEFELKGILLESNSYQGKGNFFLFFDQMGILIEKAETYPGSEVPDGWELY